MNRDDLITHTIIAIAIAGLLFLSFGSTGQFVGVTEDTLDDWTFDSNSDYDGDGVTDFEECPDLQEFSFAHMPPEAFMASVINSLSGPTPAAVLDLNKLSGASMVAPPDMDGDGLFNENDNCPSVSNPNQEDTNEDCMGDACDDDDDGVHNNNDNCPSVSNPNQEDSEIDGVGDACDNCPNDYNWDQIDLDNDGIGDSCDDVDDTDTDGDGWSDSAETDCDTDPLDSSDVPQDSNNNGMCDEFLGQIDFTNYGFSGYALQCYMEQDGTPDGTLNCYLINPDGDIVQTYEDTSTSEPEALLEAYRYLYFGALDDLGCDDTDSDGTPDWADDRYPVSCVDTDGGEELEIFGTVTSIIGSQTAESIDCCALEDGSFCKWAGPSLMEASCLSDNTVDRTQYSCPSGYCESGECLTNVPILLSDEIDEFGDSVLISKSSGHVIDGDRLLESRDIIWLTRDAEAHHEFNSDYPDETGWWWFVQSDENQAANPGNPLIESYESDMGDSLDEIDEYIRNTLGEIPPETNRWNYLYRGYQYSVSDLGTNWRWDVWSVGGTSIGNGYSLSGRSGAITNSENFLNNLLDGCMDPEAENYKHTAIEDTGTELVCNNDFGNDDGFCSCVYEGCTDDTTINGIEIATNYDDVANTDDGSCIYWGCPDVTAINYDETSIGTELENEAICGFTDMFNERACTAVISNNEYSGEALSIVQISHGATVKSYRAEIIDLDPSRNQIISILSPSDYSNAFDCEVFLWEDFGGKPIDGTNYWRYE